MSNFSVQIDEELFNAAKIEGATNSLSPEQQINFWAKVGRNAIANPDLPVDFIAQTLLAKDQETEPFNFED